MTKTRRARTRRTKSATAEIETANAFMAACPSYDEGYRDATKAFTDDTDAAYVTSSLRDAHAFYTKRLSMTGASDYTKGMAAGLATRLA
jgi:hypothetical protein